MASDAAGSRPTHEIGASPSDGQLVQRTLAGEKTAFDELIRRHQRQAVTVSYRLLGNTHDALDVTQEAFLKAFTRLSTLQQPQAFGGWLLRIVSNLSLNYRRSRKTESQLPLNDLLASAPNGPDPTSAGQWNRDPHDPVQLLQGREMGQKLQEALGRLPDKQRLAIVLFTIDQLPQKDIAEALQCSVEAVKWYVFQGRQQLRELLKEHL